MFRIKFVIKTGKMDFHAVFRAAILLVLILPVFAQSKMNLDPIVKMTNFDITWVGRNEHGRNKDQIIGRNCVRLG
jgi:hypothetical protein